MLLQFFRRVLDSKGFPFPNSRVEQKINLVLTPYHPVLSVDRCEIDEDYSNEQVLDVRIHDAEKNKNAIFHVSIGVKKGRPFCEVVGSTNNSKKSNIKRITAQWREAPVKCVPNK